MKRRDRVQAGIGRAAVGLLVLGLGVSPLPVQAESLDIVATIRQVETQGDALVAAYQPEQRQATIRGFSALYFDQFEGDLETAIGAVDPALKSRLEAGFNQVVGLSRQGVAPDVLRAGWDSLRAGLALVPVRVPSVGFGTVLWQAALILMREGGEALLVVSALLAGLSRSGVGLSSRVICQGVAWAVVASLGFAWGLSEMFSLSGVACGVIEGGTLLLAALVLVPCAGWLISARQFRRWQDSVQQDIDRAVSTGRLFILSFAAFLAVFREGVEPVLFYRALAASAPGQGAALSLGLAVALLGLAGVYAAIRFCSFRLPPRRFFAASALLLFCLAISFAGNGVVELQAVAVVPTHVLPGWPNLAWLGIHPTVEGMLAQGGIVLLALIWSGFRPNPTGAEPRTPLYFRK